MWFQGCTLGCPHCFNPQTHASVPTIVMKVADLVERLKRSVEYIEGITISGGEPFQQPAGLLELLRGVRDATNLSVVLYSGYTLTEIKKMSLGLSVLAHVDVLIDGRYVHDRRLARALRGSSNQKVHCLTSHYSFKDIERTPTSEIRVDGEGTIVITGVEPPELSFLHSIEKEASGRRFG